ncbi:MAG: phage tail protein [Desulfobacteraceae bacterium]
MATGEIPDPFGNYNFLVELDGISRAAFQECSGFDSTIDVIEHREGGENTVLRKLPGMTKYSNIVLKWGVTDDTELRCGHRNIGAGP